ncbi:MAG: DUF664 domain-containing protein [Actinomycetales bacterium]|jgi:hypothetical protein|nr:DUF664 domain-containing protein [Actinomycetales bacterium]
MNLPTKIPFPGLDAGEAEMLVFGIERSRAQFAWKVGGLDAEALRRPFPPSAMTLGGLVKHLTRVEDEQREVKWLGRPWPAVWRPLADDPEWDWRSAADDPPEVLYAGWLAAVEKSRAVLAELLADGGPDRPSAWDWGEGRTPTMRWLLVDLHEEYARHTGHADLFREAIDGLVGEDPPQ